MIGNTKKKKIIANFVINFETDVFIATKKLTDNIETCK